MDPKALREHLNALMLVACLTGCEQEAPRGSALATEPPASGAQDTPKPPSEVPPPLPAPTRLLSLRGSAYNATLVVDGDTNYLMTNDAAVRLVPGHTPERWTLPLGFTRGATTDHLVFWSNGAIRRVPKAGGEPVTVAKVPHEPRCLVTSGHNVSWLERGADGAFSIDALDGSRVRRLHAPSGSVEAMAMAGELVYFVERARDRTWRFGVVSLSGDAPYYAPAKQGRTPAMLALTNQLYYYDGPSLTVRRVSLDLLQEDVVARDVICSPIAVSEHIYCAQPAGILELGFDGVTRRELPLRGATVTAISATSNFLTWVTDIGAAQLAIDSVALAPDPRATPRDAASKPSDPAQSKHPASSVQILTKAE